jgi:hypothetical protein
MYDFAHECGVPLYPECAWQEMNVTDFQILERVNVDYRNYLEKIQPSSHTIGGLFNAHMKLYYAWRFSVIHRKIQNDQKEAARIRENDVIFEKEFAELEHDTNAAKKIYDDLDKELKKAITGRESERSEFYVRSEREATRSAMESNIRKLEIDRSRAKDNWLKANAKMSALPKMDRLAMLVDFYDRQLLSDAENIYNILTEPRLNSIVRKFDTVSDTLRPHYRAMMEAYHDEFKLNNGLRDERILYFFEEYIHDSVAGFAADATLRSDPRVIYVGGDSKDPYADAHPVNGPNPINNLA